MEYVLQTTGLSKMFANKAAVDKVNMHVRKGDIYGFIGENGAGKTTLIRMAAGLAAPTSGTLSLFGCEAPADLGRQRRRIGTMVENPAVYPSMTAEQNLEHFRLLLGIPDRRVIAETLAIVGLSDTGKKKAANFSLGMKQRLGIAISLMGKPDFLMLDEPTNGLDPTGIIEVRELLTRLNVEHGVTILISSHILGELSKLATAYGIIKHGVLVDEFSAAELETRSKRCIKIKVNDTQKASFVLESILQTTSFEVLPDNTIHLYDYLNEAANVNTELVRHDVAVESLGTSGQDLEGYFMEIMGGKKNA